MTEAPRSQRFVRRSSLEDLFPGVADRATRDERVYVAVRVHGCTLREVATFRGLYYSTVSVVAKRVGQTKTHQK